MGFLKKRETKSEDGNFLGTKNGRNFLEGLK